MEDYINNLDRDALIEVIHGLRNTIQELSNSCEYYRSSHIQIESERDELRKQLKDANDRIDKLEKIIKESDGMIGKSKADILDEAEKDELVWELSRRIGVEIHKVDPHEKKSIEVEGMAAVAVVRL